MEPVEIITFILRDEGGHRMASFTLDAADKVTLSAHLALRESLVGCQINPEHLVVIGRAMQVIIETRVELEQLAQQGS